MEQDILFLDPPWTPYYQYGKQLYYTYENKVYYLVDVVNYASKTTQVICIKLPKSYPINSLIENSPLKYKELIPFKVKDGKILFNILILSHIPPPNIQHNFCIKRFNYRKYLS